MFRQIGIGKGRAVFIEVYSPKAKRKPSGLIGSVTASKVAGKTIDQVSEISAELAGFCGGIVEKMAALPEKTRPTTIEVSFGVHVAGEGNLHIVKVTGDATLQVKVTWKASSPAGQ